MRKSKKAQKAKNNLRHGSKAQRQRTHAKNRARERYNIDLNKDKRKFLISCIQNNKYILKREGLSNRVTYFQILFGDKMANILYDKKRKEIVTFLPDKKNLWL